MTSLPGRLNPRFRDLAGQRFGRLRVIDLAYFDAVDHNARWECVCDCGNVVIRRSSLLRLAKTKSCGCLHRERVRDLNRTHGLSGTPEYNAWVNMHRRCSNPDYGEFHLYGGRGIKVCRRWSSVSAFIDDMGPRPTAEHSLDRRDNGGDYTPENCHWATKHEQSQNRRPVVLTPEVVKVLRQASAVRGEVAVAADRLGLHKRTAHAAASGETWANIE